MRVLVACESSGRVREAFRRRGHDAWSCDLDPAEDGSDYHFQGDVRAMLRGGVLGCGYWDLVIAHPPCTRLCNSGVRWLHERDLWDDLATATAFFRMFLDCAPKVAIENPIPHKYAAAQIGRKYDQIIEPWQFWHLDKPGTGEKKATCLWLHNLPSLVPTTPGETGRHQACWRMGPSPERARERSRTYLGIADAMAAQWGSPARCLICNRVLDVVGEPKSRDCGGDCLGCIEEIESEGQ